jgi:uncharacterized protein (DUF58 family)
MLLKLNGNELTAVAARCFIILSYPVIIVTSPFSLYLLFLIVLFFLFLLSLLILLSWRDCCGAVSRAITAFPILGFAVFG